METAAGLRRHAVKCRYLADITVSPCDQQVLRQAAADFDAEADKLDSGRIGVLPRGDEAP